MTRIRNKHIKNFLEENGTYPVYELFDGSAYYKKTSKLSSLLDQYTIEFICIPNKL
jgi:hypothetical protein